MSSREIYPVENLNRRWHLHFCSFCSFLRDVNQTFGKCQTVENTFDIWYLSSLWKCILLWSHDVLFVSGMFKSASNWETIRPPLYLKWVQGKPQLLIDVKTFVHFGKLVEDAPMENAFWKLFQTNQRWLWWIMMIMADNFFSAFVLTLKREVLNVEAIE